MHTARFDCAAWDIPTICPVPQTGAEASSLIPDPRARAAVPRLPLSSSRIIFPFRLMPE